jgi:hypothetical protein
MELGSRYAVRGSAAPEETESLDVVELVPGRPFVNTVGDSYVKVWKIDTSRDNRISRQLNVSRM